MDVEGSGRLTESHLLKAPEELAAQVSGARLQSLPCQVASVAGRQSVVSFFGHFE